jgi:hypothetical protein
VKKRIVVRALFICVVGAVAFGSVLWFVYRPWALTWGSTREEITREMPGDDLLIDPYFSATRAVSIQTTPEQIWPWIVQIGYRRAGFYSYDRLDNDGIPSANRILPEYQDLEIGDPIPMAEGANARVTVLEPNEAMVLVFEVEGVWAGSSWAWGMYPLDGTHTRLVTRLRVDVDSIRSKVLLDLGEIVMMRKCMLGIKRRAEAATGSAP